MVDPRREPRPVLSERFLRAVRLRRETVASFSEYPFALPAVRDLDELDTDAAVTILVGDNGTGKSTLLEAIAIALGLNPEGGSRGLRFETRASHSSLSQHLRLVRGITRPRDSFFLRAESLFIAATAIESIDRENDALRKPNGDEIDSGPPIAKSYGDVPLHERSHGETFLELFVTRFKGPGIYLLDEPEAALSPRRQLAALARMHDLVKAGSQFLVATHSPILMAYPGALIYECSENGLRRVEYQDLDHVTVMRDFLACPERVLDVLLADDRDEQAQ
jgi:predicted ATPase